MIRILANIQRISDLETIPLARPQMAPPTLAESLAEAGAVGERFLLLREPPPDDPMIRADQLNDDDVKSFVALRGRELETADVKVAASMFLQNYVYRIVAPALAMWVLHGRLPDVSATNVGLRFDHAGRPVEVALLSPIVFVRPRDRLSDARCEVSEDLTATAMDILLERHVMAMHDRVRSLFGLGTLLAKGQVASQIGMAFTAIDTNTTVPWPNVVAPAMDFLRRSHDRIAGEGKAGDMVLKRLDDSEGVTFRRGTCCLIYKTPDRGYCGGCPLRPDEERAEIYTERLMNRAPECRCAPSAIPADAATTAGGNSQ